MINKIQKLYNIIIGLEIHAELKTKSKIFCSCAAKFESIINKNCCPICIGLPGTLPTLNKRAVEYCIKMGYATKCKINNEFILDRKNYFYPDLPKAYQISQYTKPICENGNVEFYSENIKKNVRIRKIHIEEDAGKLVHLNNDKTILDFNRCGIPLIEIVTEPDIFSAQEAKDFLENITMILKYLDICDCKLEEGSLRCDVNISLKKINNTKFGTKVEIKNINSFTAIYKAIEYEINRQYKLLENGNSIIQETRRWDDEALRSVTMRKKEEENDYRYFQDPDFFYFKINNKELINLKKSIPELHINKYEYYTNELKLSPVEVLKLIKDPEKVKLFDDCIYLKKNLCHDIINWINYDISKYLNKFNIKLMFTNFNARKLIDLILCINTNIISNTTAKKILPKLFENNISVSNLINMLNYKQINNIDELNDIIIQILNKNSNAVADYKNGKKNSLGFLIGKCMQLSNNKANPKLINELLLKILSK